MAATILSLSLSLSLEGWNVPGFEEALAEMDAEAVWRIEAEKHRHRERGRDRGRAEAKSEEEEEEEEEEEVVGIR